MRFDFPLMVNSNRGRITYRLQTRNIFEYRGCKSLFSSSHYRRNAQQCRRNLYIAEKYI